MARHLGEPGSEKWLLEKHFLNHHPHKGGCCTVIPSLYHLETDGNYTDPSTMVVFRETIRIPGRLRHVAAYSILGKV